MVPRAPKKTALLIVASITIVVVAAIIVWLVLTVTTKTPSVDPVVEHDIHTFAERVKSATTYSSLPESEKQTFLDTESAKFGADTRQDVTPELVTMQCIDIYSTQLYQMARRYRDEISEYRAAFSHALMQIRDSCYANYDPDGKILPEEMPHMQAH